MSYVDAHLHLADQEYSGRIELLIENAANNRVKHLLSNAMDYDTSVETLSLARKYKGTVLAAIGVHPWTVTNRQSFELGKVEQLIEDNGKYVRAIGEIGLDGQYSRNAEKRRIQREVFQFFLSLAERRKLPAIVHSRMAADDVLQTLSSFSPPKVLLHWYSGPLEKLKEIKDRGYLISVGPSIIYSKRISEIAQSAELGLVLSETDGPVSYHGPYRGRMTQPSFVIDVVQKLAEIKSLSTETVREAIWNNFQNLISSNGKVGV